MPEYINKKGEKKEYAYNKEGYAQLEKDKEKDQSNSNVSDDKVFDTMQQASSDTVNLNLKDERKDILKEDTKFVSDDWEDKPVSQEDAESLKKHLNKIYLLPNEALGDGKWNDATNIAWLEYQRLNEIGMNDSVKTVYTHRIQSRLPAELMESQYKNNTTMSEYDMYEKYGEDFYYVNRFGDGKKNYDILSDEEYEGVIGEKRIRKEINMKDIINKFIKKQ